MTRAESTVPPGHPLDPDGRTVLSASDVARALRRADVSPAGPSDIAAAITEVTHTDPSENDLRRVRDQLSKKGWPVEFPDPDLP